LQLRRKSEKPHVGLQAFRTSTNFDAGGASL
jgi:hypothetical protein